MPYQFELSQYQFRNSVIDPFSYTSPRYRTMSGFMFEMMFVAVVSFGSPLAPSPAAATISGWPAPAAGAGVLGVKWLLFTGGEAMPFDSVRPTGAWVEAKPSRMSASISRT